MSITNSRTSQRAKNEERLAGQSASLRSRDDGLTFWSCAVAASRCEHPVDLVNRKGLEVKIIAELWRLAQAPDGIRRLGYRPLAAE
jgi:hypothetical protein